ncbi:MAG: TetR/AcrR family transcriptional regulator [Lachnospiraceae bacterium]|nr:TetR/AcrR family transcriptional regulator [Lachnospiraceae bacterium]
MNMYCGSNKTAIASQTQISNAMTALLKKKKYEDISISLLCKEANISRQTFYSLFNEKDNVIVFELQKCYFDTKETVKSPKDEKPFSEFCHGFAHYLVNNKDYFKLLWENNILYLIYESVYDVFMSCCKKSCLYMNNVTAGGLTGIARSYCEEGYTASTEELETYMSRLLVHYECEPLKKK